MVLFTAIELVADVGIWTAKKAVGLGSWLIWGTTKTESEILLDKQTLLLRKMENTLEEMKKEQREFMARCASKEEKTKST